MKISRLSRLPDSYTRYDLSIKDTHNFVAEGVVVHNTSAHITYHPYDAEVGGVHTPERLTFFSGGEKHERFVSLFNQEELLAKCSALRLSQPITVFGEAYGGKQQGMSATYGPELKFIVFDIKHGKTWLTVPRMAAMAASLGFEVVPWELVSTDLSELDRVRDKPSEVAVRRGMGEGKQREGVVLRPLIEVMDEWGERIITKHKQESFSERATPQKIIDPDKLVVLTAATAIADEWVNDQRLGHVLDKIKADDIKDTPQVIKAMIEDVYREAKGEIVESKDTSAAIGKKTAALFKAFIKRVAFEHG